jgi:hypothetical protein
MKITIVSLVLLLSLALYAKDIKITMSLDDTFTIKDNPNWIIKNERYMPLRLADISIFSKKGYAFDLKLYFKCDTKDLSNFDTAEKIKESILASSKKYLPYCVEDKIILEKLKVKRFGFYTQLTDKELIKKKKIPKGEYKYMTRGFYRVGNDSVLGFSLMTNDIDSKDYRQMIAYILSFEK